MKAIILRSCLLLGFLALAITPAVRAEGVSEIRARIQSRLPKVDSLKTAGALGENNLGFLEVRAPGEAAGVAAAENADRQKIYVEIGKNTGASPEQVGRARAKRIAERSAPGVWLQNDAGTWYKK